MVLSATEQLFMQQEMQEEQKRQERYKIAWKAYHGDTPPVLRNTLTDPKGQDNTVITYAQVIVDTVVAWLFGAEPQFNLDDQPGRNDQEAYLDQVWEANRKQLTLQKLCMNGSVCGHSYMKINPRTGDVPRLIVLDPANVTVRWDQEDIDTVWSYKIQWRALDRTTRKEIFRRQLIEANEGRASWTVTDQESTSDFGGWKQTGQIIWKYPWPPIIDTQHLPLPNEYYGQPDLTLGVLDLGASVNFSFSNNNRIERIHGHPQTWGRGFGQQNVDKDPDKIVILPGADSELHNLEMTSDHAFAFGNLDRKVEAMFRLAAVPLLAIGDVKGVTQLSGVALTLYFRPLLQKIEKLRLTYGHFLIELNRRLLELGGYGPGHICQIQWPELLPSDPLQERQALVIDNELGASKQTILEKLGYDAEQEAERRATEQEAAMARFDRGQFDQQGQPVIGQNGQNGLNGQQPPNA